LTVLILLAEPTVAMTLAPMDFAHLATCADSTRSSLHHHRFAGADRVDTFEQCPGGQPLRQQARSLFTGDVVRQFDQGSCLDYTGARVGTVGEEIARGLSINGS
jgi:hypothetical protein